MLEVDCPGDWLSLQAFVTLPPPTPPTAHPLTHPAASLFFFLFHFFEIDDTRHKEITIHGTIAELQCVLEFYF